MSRSIFLFMGFALSFSACFAVRYMKRLLEPRPALNTRFMDAARQALYSLATKNGTNDNFHRAIDKIERSLSTMQARKGLLKLDNDRKLQEFLKILEHSAKSGNIGTFREFLGRVLFQNITRLHNMNTGVIDDHKALINGAKAFLTDIKAKIGKDNFDQLISINGEVTLAFVIDSTGSMKEDIDAAKAIAGEIVTHEREVPVNFILSTFNDPDVAPVIFHDEKNIRQAITAIGNIKVDGGGDCPEMAFQGLLQALYYSPLPGSAMYVFTDAYPKDATLENIETVTALAIDLGISIYFFTSGDCGGRSVKMASFKQVAQATGGLMLPLHSSKEIKELSKFVKQNIEGSATVDSNSANETKTKNYLIAVDDTIKTMVITVIMSKTRVNVRLRTPNGQQYIESNRLDRNVIFNVDNPIPGNWTLEVPSTAGDVEYQVRTINKLNIDFSHYYFKYLPRKRSNDHLPLVHPLLGEDAMVMITVYQMQHIDNESLSMNVVYSNGTTVGVYNLHPVGNSGFRYITKIKVDNGPYRLQLVGRTKSGHKFTRLAQAQDEAKPFRLRVVYARRYILPVGKTAILVLAIDNPSNKSYEFDVSDTFGYAVDVVPQGTGTINTRRRNFNLRFKVPADAIENINKTNRVVIKAIEDQTRIMSTEIAHLLVTPTEFN